MDFKGAINLFADPDFDGEPVAIYNPDPDDPPQPPGNGDDDEILVDPPPPGPGRTKYHVGNAPVNIVRERVQFIGGDGKLVTESVKDYTRRPCGRSSFCSTIS